MRAFTTPTLPPRDVRDADDLLEAIASAAASRTRLDVQGLGSRKHLGRATDADQVLSLVSLSGITTYEPDELVLMAKAATPLSEILKALDDAGQMLAFDPQLGAMTHEAAQGTIGGVMATNLSGPRRMVAGAARDFLLGFNAVSGRGEAFQSGSRVMKNVTGYDLSKLMAGSFGTLAVMHDVTIKTMPKPEDAASLLVAAPSIEQAGAAIRAALASSFEPTAGAIVPPKVAVFSDQKKLKEAAQNFPVAVIRVEGFAVSVKNRIDALSGLLKGHGEQMVLAKEESDLVQAELRENTMIPPQNNRVTWKISCPPAVGAPLLDDILKRPNCRAYADWAGGLIWVSHPSGGDSGAEALRKLVAPHGGHVTLINAPENIRMALDVFEPQPAPLHELACRVKASFDPLGILNPGRMYDGI
ncbi:MAG: FAD-binding protein [Alphaproteobacteria bacterium]|nr:FAD-binding protein [Alphaproteobacteria bacterium]